MPIRMNGHCAAAPERPPAQNPEMPGGGSGGSGNQAVPVEIQVPETAIVREAGKLSREMLPVLTPCI